MTTFQRAFAPHKRVRFATVGPSLTHQSMSAECDINAIMQKFQKTGILDHRNNFEGQYGDFIDAPDNYHDAMNSVLEANEMFGSLPSSVRKQFANDPGLFLDFATDPANNAKMVELGLATASVVEDIPLSQKAAKAAPTPAPSTPTPEKKAEKAAET